VKKAIFLLLSFIFLLSYSSALIAEINKPIVVDQAGVIYEITFIGAEVQLPGGEYATTSTNFSIKKDGTPFTCAGIFGWIAWPFGSDVLKVLGPYPKLAECSQPDVASIIIDVTEAPTETLAKFDLTINAIQIEDEDPDSINYDQIRAHVFGEIVTNTPANISTQIKNGIRVENELSFGEGANLITITKISASEKNLYEDSSLVQPLYEYYANFDVKRGPNKEITLDCTAIGKVAKINSSSQSYTSCEDETLPQDPEVIQIKLVGVVKENESYVPYVAIKYMDFTRECRTIECLAGTSSTDDSITTVKVECEELTNPLHKSVCNKMVNSYPSSSTCNLMLQRITAEELEPIIDKRVGNYSDLDKELVYAIMWQESGIKPNAVNERVGEDEQGNSIFQDKYPVTPVEQINLCIAADGRSSFGLMQIAKSQWLLGDLTPRTNIACENWADKEINIHSGMELWKDSINNSQDCDSSSITQFDGLNGKVVTALGKYNGGLEGANCTSSNRELYIAEVLAKYKALKNNCEEEEVIDKPKPKPIPEDLECNTILECLAKIGKRFIDDILD